MWSGGDERRFYFSLSPKEKNRTIRRLADATEDAQGTAAGKIRLLRLRLASFLPNASASLALQPYDGY